MREKGNTRNRKGKNGKEREREYEETKKERTERRSKGRQTVVIKQGRARRAKRRYEARRGETRRARRAGPPSGTLLDVGGSRGACQLASLCVPVSYLRPVVAALCHRPRSPLLTGENFARLPLASVSLSPLFSPSLPSRVGTPLEGTYEDEREERVRK